MQSYRHELGEARGDDIGGDRPEDSRESLHNDPDTEHQSHDPSYFRLHDGKYI
jgi:hypothetical protein